MEQAYTKHMKKTLLGQSFVLAFGESVYVALVAIFMSNLQTVFAGHDKPGAMGFVILLLLFVISAAVSGALILGKPILIYFEHRKKEALKLFGLVLGWLIIFMIILILALAVLK